MAIETSAIKQCTFGEGSSAEDSIRKEERGNVCCGIFSGFAFGLHFAATSAQMKTTEINNRRYLGNKYKLLPFIKRVVEENCHDVRISADLFSGSGSVASAFTESTIITNDILYSNYICNLAWFSPQHFDEGKVKATIECYNQIRTEERNYMSDNFANTFFSLADCAKIGAIREDIERKFGMQEINERERALLITSLLYAMDKIANTCGHYDAFRRGAAFEKQPEMYYPNASNGNNRNNRCYNSDINAIAGEIAADIVYLDPPYNSRQYCDAYHLLENVARWEKPAVFGVARKMDRGRLKSKYCTRSAAAALKDLVGNLNCRYILLSYNNMKKKGNDRSNAKISDEDINRILSTRGAVRVFSERYRPFSAGKSDIRGNEERLFLCECE